jgi:hypothetical protein
LYTLHVMINLIGGAVVNMVVLTAVDRGFKPQLGQTKDYKIGICWFTANKQH